MSQTMYWHNDGEDSAEWLAADGGDFLNWFQDADHTTPYADTAAPEDGDTLIACAETAAPSTGPGEATFTNGLAAWDFSAVAVGEPSVTSNVLIASGGSVATAGGTDYWSGDCSAATTVSFGGGTRLADGASVGHGRTVCGFRLIAGGTITVGDHCTLDGGIHHEEGDTGGTVNIGTGAQVTANLDRDAGDSTIAVNLSDGAAFSADQTVSSGLTLTARLAATQSKQDLQFSILGLGMLNLLAGEGLADQTLVCDGLILDGSGSEEGAGVAWDGYSVVQTTRGLQLVAGDLTWSWDTLPRVDLQHEGFDADFFGLAARSDPDHAAEADVKSGVDYDHGAKTGTLAAAVGGAPLVI